MACFHVRVCSPCCSTSKNSHPVQGGIARQFNLHRCLGDGVGGVDGEFRVSVFGFWFLGLGCRC